MNWSCEHLWTYPLNKNNLLVRNQLPLSWQPLLPLPPGCSKVTCISLTQEASLQLSPLHGQQISIHYLDMTDCFSLEDEGLRTIASHCPRLTHLYLRRCIRLTDEALRHLALHCPSIKELSLSDCRLVGDFGLREVARLEGCLRYLSVAHCTRITDVGMRYVARYCPRLRYLNARGCEGLTDHGMSHLARSCPKLKSLDVGKCPLVSDSGLEQLAMYCQGLRRMSLRACESVTGRGLKALAANCCELQLLNVQDCEVSPEALRFVRRHCRRCVIEHTNPAFYWKKAGEFLDWQVDVPIFPAPELAEFRGRCVRTGVQYWPEMDSLIPLGGC